MAFEGRQRSRSARYVPSKELVNAAYRFLSAETWMIFLLFVGGLTAMTAISVILDLSILLGAFSFNAGLLGDWINVLIPACATWVCASVTVLVAGAATTTALIRAGGGVPTARTALAVVWARRRPLAAWAFVSAVAGVLFTLLSRFGLVGVVAQFAATIGWTTAVMFAVPIVITQGTMPAATVRQSAAIVRASFGAVARGGVKLAAPWTVAEVGAVLEAIASGVIFLISDSHPNGILIFVLLFCIGAGVLFFVGVASAGLAAYLNTILFRFAAGQRIPGIDPAHLPMPSAAS